MNRRWLQATLLISALILLAAVIVMALNIPTPKPPTLINITRSEYDKAYDRWRQRKVVEYMITTREVTSSTNCVASAKVFVGGQVNINGQEDCRDRNQYSTAEWLFDAIDKRLKTVQNPGVQDKTTSWLVEFDPEMGYPKRLDIMPAPNAPENVITSTTTVERINILKATAPGTSVKTVAP